MEAYPDMKKIISAIVLLTMMIFPLSTNAFAANGNAPILLVDNQSIEYYEDGSYSIITVSAENSAINAPSQNASAAVTQTITGSKSSSYYSSNDELQWTVTLRGTFSYNGSSATCTQSTVSSVIYDSNWKVTSAVASKSGATAIGDFVVKYYTLLVPIKTINVHLTITCSANGTLS